MPSGNREAQPAPILTLPPQGSGPREAFLVLPGLNLHPHRLDPCTALLTAAGAASVAPRLSGFAQPGDAALRRVRPADWLADLDAVWDTAVARLPQAAPSLLGFSFGGLLGLVWALERGVALRRAILLSPAMRLRRRHRVLIRTVGAVLPGALRLPSRAPPQYRFHPGTTVAAYRALTALEKRLRPRLRAWLGGDPTGLPTLLLAYAPQDELIDTAVFRALARALPERVTLVPLSHRARPGFPAHLALDAHTLGEAEWQRLAALIADWLRRTQPGPAPDDGEATR